jgi:hypothetical protein
MPSVNGQGCFATLVYLADNGNGNGIAVAMHLAARFTPHFGLH